MLRGEIYTEKYVATANFCEIQQPKRRLNLVVVFLLWTSMGGQTNLYSAHLPRTKTKRPVVVARICCDWSVQYPPKYFRSGRITNIA